MGDDDRRLITDELVLRVRKNVTIDWTLWECVRALTRVPVRRIRRKQGYPPDLQAEAPLLEYEPATVLRDGSVG